MSQPANESLDDLLSSGEAARWQDRLTRAFFDDQARLAVIGEIRLAVAARVADGGEAGIESLQRRVLQHLIGVASRDASPPDREPEPIAMSATGPGLEDLIVTGYPNPIAVPYRALTEQASAAGAFGCLLDTFEGFVHFLATVAVSAYLRGALTCADCNRHLLERFIKDAWSTGDLMSLLRETIRHGGDFEGRLPYPELPGHLFDPRGRPTASLRVLESFVTLRNRVWSHGTGRDEDFFASILEPNLRRLDRELASVPWLGSWELVRPLVIDESGRVSKADLLMGERRLKARDFDLKLQEADLDHRGGDVRPETSLLLVAPDRASYLPLFPLCLFHFHLKSQGVYFLQRPQWQRQDGRRQIRRAGFITYQSGLNPYESGPGEPAARSIERHVGRLEEILGGGTQDEAPALSTSTSDPDCELPEVRLEQEYHLRTFAGREPFLRRIGEWIDGQDGGGYLLLLGPPGQGKSALMAELARLERERGGCLLHMIRSHRNPLKFLPSLITQAARLVGACFGPGAYRGDVDDLRNSLIMSLEAVQVSNGRAVMVVDGLDELDMTGERIEFLPESLPVGVRVVLTCRPDIPLVHALRARLKVIQEWKIPALSGDDIAVVLRRRLGDSAVDSLAGRVDWRTLLGHVRGNPLFLHRALDQVARLADAARTDGGPLDLDPSIFPTTLEGLFEGIYNEISEKQGTRYVTPEGREKSRLLQLICLAREPVGFEALAGLMTPVGSPISLEDCRDRILEMSQYLLDSADNRFRPWHQGLSDYVKGSILGEAGCRRVEAAFADWLDLPSNRRSPYAMRHWVRHLLAAGRSGDAGAMLTDLAHLEAKVEAGMVYDLLLDFAEVIRALESGDPLASILPLLEEALLADAYFIARHPATFFQCLWNRGWWYDCREAAGHHESTDGDLPAGRSPGDRPGPRLSTLLEVWLAQKERQPGFRWIRSLVPPRIPLGAGHRVALHGHLRPIQSLGFSADGRRISAGSGGLIRVWDVASGVEISCLQGDSGQPRRNVLAVSPDGRLVAGTDDRGIVAAWQADTGAELSAYDPGSSNAVGMTFSPDARRLAGVFQTVGGRKPGGIVQIRDAESGVVLIVLDGHDRGVSCVAFSPDGSRLASGSEDGTIRIWDARSGEGLLRIGVEGECISLLTFSPDGRRLATATESEMIRIWDLETGISHVQFAALDRVRGIEFTADGGRLIGVSSGGEITTWDAETGVELHELGTVISLNEMIAISPDASRALCQTREGEFQSYKIDSWTSSYSSFDYELAFGLKVTSFSPDGNRVASVTEAGEILLGSMTDGRLNSRLGGHSGRVNCLSFTPDGMGLASASDDGTARIWDLRGGSESHHLAGDKSGVTAVAFSPEGNRLAGGLDSGAIRVWAVGGGSANLTLSGHNARIRCLAFSPDGRRLASGSDDGTMRVWDTSDGLEVTRVDDVDAVIFVAFSPDGQRVVSRAGDEFSRAWNAQTGEELANPFPHNRYAEHMSLSPDGEQMAYSIYLDGWRACLIKSGVVMESPAASANPPIGLSFTSDGLHLMIGFRNGLTRRLELKTLAVSEEIWNRSPVISSLAISDDGNFSAIGTEHGTIIVFERDNHSYQSRIRFRSHGHRDAVGCMAFEPGGKRLVSGSRDGTVRFWDFRSDDMISIRLDCRSGVKSVRFAPDGLSVVGVLDDGTARVWNPGDGSEMHLVRAEGVCSSASASAHDRHLLIGLVDGTVAIWDLSSGSWRPPLGNLGSPVSCLAFSQEGHLAAAGSRDGNIKVWDVHDGVERFRARAFHGAIRGLAIKGGRLIAFSGKGASRAWFIGGGSEALLFPFH